MSQLSDLIDGGYVKQPGQWRRSGENGPPIVTDPNGVANKTGARKGQVKLLTYSRPSNFGKQVENTFNLEKWNERMVALGIAAGIDGYDDRGVIQALVDGDHDSPAWKQKADGIVVAAKRAAGAFIKAEQGTHGHYITEDHDLDRSVIGRIEAGEDIGLPANLQAGIAQVWQRLIGEHFDVLAVEEPCVYDEWRVAGTLDRIVRLKHDLSFQKVDGYDYTIEQGTVIVLDIKTGGLKLDRNGLPQYWHSYAVQIAAYANSQPYNVDTERRYEWPWEISLEHAVIAHIDIGGAVDTDIITAQLFYVDLAAGAMAGDLVCAAKDWQRRRDVFSPADTYVMAHTIETPPVSLAEAAPAGEGPALTSPAALISSTTHIVPLARDLVVARARRLVGAGHGLRLSYAWPDGVPGLKGDHQHTVPELRAIYDAICQVEDEQGMSPGFTDPDQTLPTTPSWDEQRRLAAIAKACKAWGDYWDDEVMHDILAGITGELIVSVQHAVDALTLDEATRLADIAHALDDGCALEYIDDRWVVTQPKETTQ
jgi:hypothetical protein